MWEPARARAGCSIWNTTKRRLSSAIRQVEDEGDWSYSSEWWGTESDGHTVFRTISDKGNGIVSVVAHPASRPAVTYWPAIERWLEQRYEKIHPGNEQCDGQFRVLGYQWRVLRFNDDTRQSAVKIMAAYKKSDPTSVFFMQQPHCLAVPYVKSMISSGLAALASCNYDFISAVCGKKNMNVLCIGHGGGSIPLFLASKIIGANIHTVEIDPVVISASIEKMGFPALSIKNPVDDGSDLIDQVLWKGLHERLSLCESDAENFVINNTNVYDLVFVDAYDGDDIFPRKLWDPDGPFLKALEARLHPAHGTVVVNLHADTADDSAPAGSGSSLFHHLLPMGKHVSQVCKAYKEALGSREKSCKGREKVGVAFTVTVPWVQNISLVVCRGFGKDDNNELSYFVNRDLILSTLASSSQLVEKVLNLPFSCLQYIKRGFMLVD